MNICNKVIHGLSTMMQIDYRKIKIGGFKLNLSIATKEMFGQNQINIFQDENNEVFMTREQIGQALEYSEPGIAISKIHKRNKERLDNFSVVTRLVSTDGKSYETVIYNEKGIYEIARKSAQPKADEFYDWVYDILSKIRKGELLMIKPNNTKLLLKTALEHEEKIETIESDVQMLKDTMRIDGSQEFKIKNKANQVVVEALGGKNSSAYEKLSRKAFSEFWRDFKSHFGLPRYGDLPKKHFKDGLKFIGMWQPSTGLRIEIQSANQQLKAM